MTPKEKAKELHEEFMKPVDALHKYPMYFDTAKQCALFFVNEILNILFQHHEIDYWKEVKKELIKL